MQRMCNGLNLQCESQDSNMCKLNGLGGGPGESRTPDPRFRNWAAIPQLVCFQCLQFGQFRAVLGLVGSRTCNRSCNARPKLTFILLPELIASVLRVRDEPDSSHSEIASSIKGDVNKKASPSAGSREVFCLDIQPTVCRWLSIAREVLLWIAVPFPRFIFSW
jgi:hypothetical protein